MLLNCPSGEEAQILNANQDLVDAGLVEAILQVAANLTQQGALDNANRLMNIARELLESYSQGNASAAAIREEYFKFLMKVLQTTHDSNGNAGVVYPLLQENLDKLDDNFVGLLRQWATATLPNIKPVQARVIAHDIGHFSNLIQQFPLGNRASNLETAITGYEVIATVFTHNA